MSRLEPFQNIVEDFIHAFRGRERFLDALIDLLAIAFDIENGRGANGKFKNLRGIVAFVGAADLKLAQTQRVDHFGGAGDQGDDSHPVTITPTMALAFLFCRLLIEQLFEFLGLTFGGAQGGNVQKAELELELGKNLHTCLYRMRGLESIGGCHLNRPGKALSITIIASSRGQYP